LTVTWWRDGVQSKMPSMDYAAAQDAFFQPRPADAPPPPTAASPARSLRDAAEPIATLSWWGRPVYDRQAALGLNFLTGYVWGRGSALGEPAGSVVAAAFGVFEPGLVVSLYDEARSLATHDQIRQTLQDGVVEAMTTVQTDDTGLDSTVDLLRRAVAATDGFGRPLTAGLLALPWPAEPWAQLWHGCAILREFRGDSHLAACVAAGVDGVSANILTERMVGWEPLAYTATRGWSPEAMRASTERLSDQGLLTETGLSDEGQRFRDGIEQVTEAAMQPVVEALGDDLERLIDALQGWSDAVIAHGWFPPDPYKRASG
jgi:hypothetical protein